jgi:hypothetical protein
LVGTSGVAVGVGAGSLVMRAGRHTSSIARSVSTSAPNRLLVENTRFTKRACEKAASLVKCEW